MVKWHRKAGLLILALAAVSAAAFASPASAVSVPNACTNSVTANNTEIDTGTLGSAPFGPVTGGNTISLTGIQQQVGVPGAVFVAGYNLGLLHTGANNVPVNLSTVIEATNTTQGQQTTPTVGGSPPDGSVTVSTTITDPDGTAGTGDETATPATGTVSYPDMNWTAAVTGDIEFRQQSIATAPPGPANNTLLINARVGASFIVQFRCAPATVTPPDPGTITLIDPAPTFASTAATPPVADAGPDQTVFLGAPAQLDGTGSDDPDGDPLTYAWTQAAGPSVTLSDAASPTPTFTAPSSPATLAFDLQVCDDDANCDTDSVTVAVTARPTATVPPVPPAAATNPKCKKLRKQLKKARKAHDKAKVKKIKKKLRKLRC
jgi:PKD domain